jgi:hypothetical protein
VTPHLTIAVSASPSMTEAVNISNHSSADLDNPTRLSRADDLPIRSGTFVGPVTDSQMKMSHTLDRAEEAMDMVKTWKNTVDIIKRVMDTVSPILEVCPISSFPAVL